MSTRELYMPPSVERGKAVYQRWDRLNGRYYVTADVRLSDGSLHRGVHFDGDTRIAVLIGGQPAYEVAGSIGKQIVSYAVTSDYSSGRGFGVASPEERAAFEAEGAIEQK
jgi:hypothetical protein